MSVKKQICVDRRGYSLLQHPLWNKDLAFSDEERHLFGLHGLLPAAHQSLEQQVRRYRQQLQNMSPEEQYLLLMVLYERNQVLFYRLLLEHLEMLLPVLYTPNIGAICQNYSRVVSNPQGLWLTPPDKPHFKAILRNFLASHLYKKDIRLMVVTDNSRILGLGDLGAGGMGISFGKLLLYTVAAGIHPGQTLPISLDVGTDNEALLSDEYYIGYRQRRLRGEAYSAFIEAFVEAVKEVFPYVLLQWEDFHRQAAFEHLQRYRHSLASFNDDIQGTAAVTVAGILAALRHSGQTLHHQRFVYVGSGSAGIGIGALLKQLMVQEGMSEQAIALAHVYCDSQGLVHAHRHGLEAHKQPIALSPEAYAHYGFAADPVALQEVIEQVKPTVLIGTSAEANAFTEPMIRCMAQHTPRPIILPLSNPTSKAECTPQQAIEWSKGRAIVATGSPFDAVFYGNQQHVIGQCNNLFIFPGVGLASLAGKLRSLPDGLFAVAAQALAEQVPVENFTKGLIYPSMSDLRHVSYRIACAVLEEAQRLDLLQVPEPESIGDLIEQMMWYPEYPCLVI